MEELFIKYNFKNGAVTFGQQLINTPFINLQDGRMRPTLVAGLYGHWQPASALKAEGGVLTGISPRSTVRWFKIGESVGLLPQGRSVDGSASNYAGHTESRAVGLVGVHYAPHPQVKVHVWNTYADNLFNVALVQADIEGPRGFVGGLQVIRQDVLGHGGNADPSRNYAVPGSKSWVFGARVGQKIHGSSWMANYTRITAHGRYLMPREWGRDPFFTFMPRERNEGLGDVHAATWAFKQNLPRQRLTMSLTLGYFHLPDVKNAAINKYALPSYGQANFDVRYRFVGLLQGLEGQLLLVGKLNVGETYDNPAFMFNKTDMWLTNVVLNYHF